MACFPVLSSQVQSRMEVSRRLPNGNSFSAALRFQAFSSEPGYVIDWVESRQ